MEDLMAVQEELKRAKAELATLFEKETRRHLLRAVLWTILALFSLVMGQIRHPEPTIYLLMPLMAGVGLACGAAMTTYRNRRMDILGFTGAAVIALAIALNFVYRQSVMLQLFFAYDAARNLYLGLDLRRQSRYLPPQASSLPTRSV